MEVPLTDTSLGSHCDVTHVTNLDQALALVDAGGTRIISRVPITQLIKLAGLVRAGAFDFCGTLTTGSQWRTLDSLMPSHYWERGLEKYRWYQENRHNRQPHTTSLEDPDWFLGSINPENLDAIDASFVVMPIMHAEAAGVLMRDIQEAGRHLPIRPGAKELLCLTNPRVVISFGLETMILPWLQQYDIKSAVAATRVEEDELGRVCGFNVNLVLPSTKRLAADRFRALSGLQEEELLILGDTIFDADMMQPRSFNVLIVPPGETDQKLNDFRNGNLAYMWDRLTMILISDSLMPLVELIRQARKEA